MLIKENKIPLGSTIILLEKNLVSSWNPILK